MIIGNNQVRDGMAHFPFPWAKGHISGSSIRGYRLLTLQQLDYHSGSNNWEQRTLLRIFSYVHNCIPP